MRLELRIGLIVISTILFVLCIIKIKQSKIKPSNSVVYLLGCVALVLMAIFSDAVMQLANVFGFIAPVNFVFLVFIGFLLVQVFIDNIRICTLNEKIKELNHFVALKETERQEKETKNEKEEK